MRCCFIYIYIYIYIYQNFHDTSEYWSRIINIYTAIIWFFSILKANVLYFWVLRMLWSQAHSQILIWKVLKKKKSNLIKILVSCNHASVVYNYWILTNNEEHTYIYIYKYNHIFLFFDADTCVEQESSERESSITQRCQNSQWKLNFSQNSRPYIVLKHPCDPHDYASSPIQCLFIICYGLQQCNTFSPLVMTYTFFNASGIMSTYFCFFGCHSVDFIYVCMHLSTPSAGFITC